jgi:hypothetical protein
MCDVKNAMSVDSGVTIDTMWVQAVPRGGTVLKLLDTMIREERSQLLIP